MIGYVTLGTNNLQKAISYYDALLDEMGAKRVKTRDRSAAWAISPPGPALSVIEPLDRRPASAGNGVMVALAVASRAMVDLVHARACELGGANEGPPGHRREDGSLYIGYFRDLDGNKLGVFCPP